MIGEHHTYILDEKGNPIIEKDIKKWGEWLERYPEKRVIARDTIGNVTVSTVFLGIDHNFTGDDPLLYETLIIGGEHDGDMKRYKTREEAQKGHDIVVSTLKLETGV